MRICIFGASGTELDEIYIKETEALGRILAARGHSLIFGGGKNSRDWGEPKYRPVTVPDAIRNQPGFNPNSPVSIPDAFRR